MDEQRRRFVAWVAREIMPHEAGVRAWLRRALVRPEDANDLIQEAYARLAALTSTDQIERPGSYFFQIVRNLHLEEVRRARVVRIETATEIESLPVCSDEPSPERTVAARRELDKVRALIEDLPQRCRRIFELRKIHGLSQREIAKVMGVSESIVENDGAKAMRLILEALREEGAGYESRELGSDGKSRKFS